MKPSEAAFKAAADQADWTKSAGLAPDMLNLGGEATWPIVSATYILLPTNPTDAAKSATVMKFFDWAYGADGDALAAKLHYIPLPDTVADAVRKAWPANIKGPDGKAVAF